MASPGITHRLRPSISDGVPIPAHPASRSASRWKVNGSTFDPVTSLSGLVAFGCVCKVRRQRVTVRAASKDETARKSQWRLWMACAAALPGSFQYGFGLSSINVPQASICKSLHLAPTSLTWSGLVAILSPAGLVGAWLAPVAVSRFGLLTSLRSTWVFFVISGCLFPLANLATSSIGSLSLFAAGRMVGGIGAGAATVLVPLYLGRIAPLKLRGAIGNLHQVAIVFGLLVAQFAGALLSWPRALQMAAAFGLLQLMLTPFLREVATQEETSRSGGFRALTDPQVRRPLVMAILLMALQQYCGINGVWYYSTEFFTEAGLPHPLAGSLLSSVIFMFATLASVPLIEKAGRRKLLLQGQVGAATSLAVLTTSLLAKAAGFGPWTTQLTLAAVIGFVVSFAVSLGPIPWQIANEIFPLRCRAEAQCLIASVCEIFSASVALGFPVLENSLGATLAFTPSIAVLLAGFAYVSRKLPETKNREVEDILADFNQQ